jgi:hypothetical protein
MGSYNRGQVFERESSLPKVHIGGFGLVEALIVLDLLNKLIAE